MKYKTTKTDTGCTARRLSDGEVFNIRGYSNPTDEQIEFQIKMKSRANSVWVGRYFGEDDLGNTYVN